MLLCSEFLIQRILGASLHGKQCYIGAKSPSGRCLTVAYMFFGTMNWHLDADLGCAGFIQGVQPLKNLGTYTPHKPSNDCPLASLWFSPES